MSAPSPETMETMTTPKFHRAMEGSVQESIIVELTQRLAEREAHIRSITKQKMSLESYLHSHHQQSGKQTIAASEAYETLLSKYTEREENLRAVTDDLEAATKTKQELDKKLNELEKLVREFQHNSTLQRIRLQDRDDKLVESAKMHATVEDDNQALRANILEMEGVINGKEGVIDHLNREKGHMTAKSKESEKRVKNMKDELAGYQELLEKSKSLAEEQINVLLQNENTIRGLEDTNADLKDEVARLKEQRTKDKHTIESKDTMLNMQRQEMADNEALINVFQAKFQAKGVDVPSIVARAEKGERLWAKIEEREKRFAAKDIMLSAFRDENTAMQSEKKKLQAEVRELKECFEMYELKLKGTEDKVDMPWLLAQLRDSVVLKEKINELEEVIRCKGYTVKAKEAENAYKEKEIEMSREMEKILAIIDALNGQTGGEQDVEVSALLGKLEEALIEIGRDHDTENFIPPIVSGASSYINHSMSLNSNNSFPDDKAMDSMCITTRDFKDLMHPSHYAIISSLAEGFGSLKTEGLCGANIPVDDDDEEEEEEEEEDGAGSVDRYDIVDTQHSVDEEDNKGDPEVSEKIDECKETDEVADLHIEKVLKIVDQADTESAANWRNWITPPSSPQNATTTAGTDSDK